MNKSILNKDKKKTTKGITLIALVITIIVLLILAGVSIATLTGENGILTQATNAKETSEIEEIKEKIRVEILGVQAENKGKISEEELNTILEKYGEISGEDEQKVITTSKGYVIEVKDIYKGTLTNNNGKTIADLYDGINDSTNEKYNNDAMHIGDYVNYDAGKWEETVIIPAEYGNMEQRRFKFGGYKEGQSRNANATGMYDFNLKLLEASNKEGWRVWDISEDKKTMILISAGCPETFLCEQPSEWEEYKYNYENILTGDTNGRIIDSDPYEPRIWNMYVNSKQYATNARTVTKSDIDNWYKKYINNSIEDINNIELMQNTNNKLISLLSNGATYWIATVGDDWNELYYMNSAESKVKKETLYYGNPYNYGIRVLVTLSTDVKFNETPQKVEGASHDGFVYNKWEIVAK